MKIFRTVIMLAAVFALFFSSVTPVVAVDDENPVALEGCLTLDAQAPLYHGDRLLETAESVILYELNSDTLVYAYEPDKALDPAGMNKLMTALLAAELAQPDELVTVTRDALNSVAIGAVSAGLKSGEILTLESLLYLMMVGSANDAAAVIAAHVGGSQEGFVTMMNQKAEELGCTGTRFLNANGLEHDDQYTTARDLAKITAAALKNELFVQLFSALEYTVPATEKSEERHVLTTNHLMSKETVRDQYDERVTGGKTGALSTTNRSLISTAESGGLRYLSVVMGAKGQVTSNGLSVIRYGSFEETRELLDHGFGTYAIRQVLHDGRTMEQFSVPGGENDVVVRPSETLSVNLPKEVNPLDISYRCVKAENLSAPLQAGQTVGSVEVWYQSICVGQCDLVAMFAVAQPGTNSFFIQPTAHEQRAINMKSILMIGGIVILALVVIAAVTLLVIRLMRAHHDKHLGKWGKSGRRGF